MVDVLFHFGHSRLLEDDRIVYIEYYHDVDVEAAVLQALPMLGKRVGVVTTVQHIHMLPKIEAILAAAGKEPVVKPGDSRITYPGQLLGCNFSAAPQDVDSILFVGTGNFHPMGVQMTTTGAGHRCRPVHRRGPEGRHRAHHAAALCHHGQSAGR